MEQYEALNTAIKENINPNTIFKSTGAVINNNHTDIVFAEFVNKIFLIVTQYKRLGSLVSVQKFSPSTASDNQNYTYDINTLFGSNEKEYLTARYLTEAFSTEKQILVFSTLKDHSRETLEAIRSTLINLINN
uniref:Putative proteasome assembly chaperone 3-like trichogramma pretiosum n=1 Tax=Xenopsylla cheopis TaxID=163159 RepID=A0A6M2DEX7_XENCH